MQDNPVKEKITVTPQGWLALIIMLCMFSGLFGNFDGSLKFLRALDLNVLIGSFGKIGEGGLNYMGAGGSGVRDGFLFALSLAPATIFCMAIMCGLPFVNSLNSSDIAAVLTKQIHDNGQMTDDERTILVSFMYPSSAPITNMISTQAPVLPIAVMALGPMILILVFSGHGARADDTDTRLLQARRSQHHALHHSLQQQKSESQGGGVTL